MPPVGDRTARGGSSDLRAAGLRSTPQRQLILEVLGRSPLRHWTADEVLREVGERYPGFNRSTVYRVLDSLVGAGLAVQHIINAVARYELASDVHHHLVCHNCHAVFDLTPTDLRAVATVARRQHGFVVGAVGVTVEGTCAACAVR